MNRRTFLALSGGCAAIVGFPAVAVPGEGGVIRNPVAPEGHDPWVIRRDGWYYYCYSHNGGIWVNRSAIIQDAVQFNGAEVWRPEQGKPWSREIWAPELHFLDGRWYIYFAADDGKNEHHRMYVLEGGKGDARGAYSFGGKISDPSDKWAIDGTVMRHRGKLYFIWSGWEGDENVSQNIYIARMRDPLTITGERATISRPEYDWETIGRPLTRGPAVQAPGRTVNSSNPPAEAGLPPQPRALKITARTPEPVPWRHRACRVRPYVTVTAGPPRS